VGSQFWQQVRVLPALHRDDTESGGIGCDIFGICDDFPSTSTDWTWKGQNVIAKVSAQLSPRLLNDFQFGYSNNALSYVTSSSPILRCLPGQDLRTPNCFRKRRVPFLP